MKGFFGVIVSILFSITLMAQTGTIRGNVYDKESGEAIIFSNLVLEGTSYGATTDLNGFYTLANVDVGSYKLKVSYIGYEPIIVEVNVKEGQITSQNIYLTASSIQLGVVQISAAREQARNEVQISKVRVTPKQIKALPSTGGEADIAQYIQVLPGVVSTGDQGGQLYIRGGSPVQNKIMLDGLTLFNPFHSIGFFSVFETELIRNVDVLTGGFDASHGGRISAIVDIKTREGNKTRFGGTVSANPFVVKGLFEGPIKKFTEGGSSLSFVLTSKKSIIDKTSPTLYKSAARVDSIGLPFDFHDNYGKLSYVSNNGSKFNVFGFSFDDTFDDPGLARIGWNTVGGGMNFNLVPRSSSMIIAGNAGYSKYDIAFQESEDAPRESSLKSFNVAMDFTFFGKNSEINYGFDLSGVRTDFEFTNPFGVRLAEFQNTTEFSGYTKYRQKLGDLIIEPGVRVQYYASLGEISFEPRLGLKYNIADNLRLKAAGGIYSQNIISTSNERDVVNLFSGFLSGPEAQVPGLDGQNIDSKLQKARHAVGGFEVDLTKNLQVNIEGYIKDFSQLLVVNRNKTAIDQSNFAVENGEAYGVDFSAKYETPSLYLWMTYSLGYVDRFDGQQEFPTVFDRRHNSNILASYTFGNDNSWQASARWNFGSGFPFTKTQGFFNQNPFAEGVSTDYLTDNSEEVGILYEEQRNAGRLPSFHRLDLSLQKTINFSRNTTLDIILSATNVYNRNNIFYFDRVEFERVDQLPLMPSAGIKLQF